MRRKILSLITAATLVSVCLSGCSFTNAVIKETEQEIEQTKENLANDAEQIGADLDKATEDMLNAFADLNNGETEEPSQEEIDHMKADEVAALIDAIYVQERTQDTDAQCAAAKAAWDALTDDQKELVEGEEADPDYFGRDTGDASSPSTSSFCSSVSASHAAFAAAHCASVS